MKPKIPFPIIWSGIAHSLLSRSVTIVLMMLFLFWSTRRSMQGIKVMGGFFLIVLLLSLIGCISAPIRRLSQAAQTISSEELEQLIEQVQQTNGGRSSYRRLLLAIEQKAQENNSPHETDETNEYSEDYNPEANPPKETDKQKSARKAARVIFCIIGCVFLGISIFCIASQIQVYQEQLSQRDWIQTSATVTKVQMRQERRSNGKHASRYITVYDITYEYHADDVTYTGSDTGRRSPVFIGDSLTVKYDPEDVSQSTDVLTPYTSGTIIVIAFSSVFFIIGFFMSGLFSLLRRLFRRRKPEAL